MDLRRINVLLLIKYSLICCIVAVIIGSIYYLVTAVKMLHLILDQYDRAQRLETTDNFPNSPLTKYGREMFERHEKSLYVIISLSAISSFVSAIGLLGTVREYLFLIIGYACVTILLFVSNFIVVAHLKPWLMALMAMVVLLAVSFAYQIRKEKTFASVALSVDYYRHESKK